jgi:hypothetical protein
MFVSRVLVAAFDALRVKVDLLANNASAGPCAGTRPCALDKGWSILLGL